MKNQCHLLYIEAVLVCVPSEKQNQEEGLFSGFILNAF